MDVPQIDTTNQGTAQEEIDTPTGGRLRVNYDVNSPRKPGTAMTYPTNEAEPTAPAGFVTQVSREDAENIQKQQQEIVEGERGCCSCFLSSCQACLNRLFCGFFGPKKETATPDGGNIEVVTTVPDPQPQTAEAPNEPDSESEEPEGLLGPKDSTRFKGKKCLVLDLDETLVHSSFKPVPDADFIVPVEIEGTVYKVYVLKRPYVDEFLDAVAKHYEVVIFTASLSKYANPLLDMLDKNQVVSHRLFRESCVLHGQAYVKDMSKIGRKMRDIIIVDNSPLSYAFQPTSAIPISSWFDDRSDMALKELIPVLETTIKDIRDVRDILDANNKSYKWLCNQANI